MTKRVIVFGAVGQVGKSVMFAPRPEGWELLGLSRAECDITNHGQTQKALRDFQPDLVMNCAAMTAVDACETQKEQAIAANFDAVANLAAQCSVMDVPIIHLSTDYVFDGKDGEVPYKPDDLVNPLSLYADSKLMGEEALRHTHPWHVILRVSSVFSAYGQNLLPKIMQWIDTRDEIKVVTDQRSCPTYAPDIAQAMIVIAQKLLRGARTGYGTFHYCGEGPVTRYEFVQAVMETYAPYTDRRPKLIPALSSDFPGFAVRPAYSVLDCTSLTEAYGITQRPWREGLTGAMTLLTQERKKTEAGS